ncbi:MAG: hypothetical protein JWP59_2109 [Massilia sp.]|nr:hypothetical protein [Massilia sp.]
MSTYSAYIGEAGDHALTPASAAPSRYFLVLALVVDAEDAPALRSAVAAIASGHFKGARMDSHGIDDDGRLAVLTALARLAQPFRFYAVAVDKARVERDSGLQYESSFIKFVNGRLYKALFQNLGDVTVVADGAGSAALAAGFTQYLETHHMPDLFSRPRVETADRAGEVLLQLAGFLAGTAAQLYEGQLRSATRQQLIKVFGEVLGARRIRIDEWPPRFESEMAAMAPSADDSNSDLNAQVRRISLRAAARFLTDFADFEDVELRTQHALLSYLLFRARFPLEEDFISTQELVEHLASIGFDDINAHYLRSNVISRLRDRDVLIASSARGYKIPTTYADIVGFAELVDGIVSPLLHRLQRANEVLSMGSAGAIDFLGEERFKKLRDLLKMDAAP